MHPDNNTSHHMTNAVFGRFVGKHDHTNKKQNDNAHASHSHRLPEQRDSAWQVKSSAEQTVAAPTINIVRTGLPGLDVGEIPRRAGFSPAVGWRLRPPR